MNIARGAEIYCSKSTFVVKWFHITPDGTFPVYGHLQYKIGV